MTRTPRVCKAGITTWLKFSDRHAPKPRLIRNYSPPPGDGLRALAELWQNYGYSGPWAPLALRCPPAPNILSANSILISALFVIGVPMEIGLALLASLLFGGVFFSMDDDQPVEADDDMDDEGDVTVSL